MARQYARACNVILAPKLNSQVLVEVPWSSGTGLAAFFFAPPKKSSKRVTEDILCRWNSVATLCSLLH